MAAARTFTPPGGCVIIPGPMTATLVSVLIALLYAGSAVLLARELKRADHPASGKWQTLAPALTGALAHAALLATVLFAAGGIALGFYSALSLASFAIVSLYLALAALRPVEMLGIGLLPIAAVTVLAGLAGGDVGAGPRLSGEVQFHAVVSLLAYGVLSVSAMQAILVGVQAHLLRTHQPGGFARALPPLSRMEELLFQMLGVGFVLLSVALASGFAYLENMFDQHLVHKTILSLVAWVVFAGLLAGRYAWGWRGQRAVRWTLSGLGFLLLAYFGSKFVLELVLQR